MERRTIADNVGPPVHWVTARRNSPARDIQIESTLPRGGSKGVLKVTRDFCGGEIRSEVVVYGLQNRRRAALSVNTATTLTTLAAWIGIAAEVWEAEFGAVGENVAVGVVGGRGTGQSGVLVFGVVGGLERVAGASGGHGLGEVAESVVREGLLPGGRAAVDAGDTREVVVSVGAVLGVGSVEGIGDA